MKNARELSLFGNNSTDRERVISALSAIHNNFYANDGLSPEQALEETVKLLFVKFLDEKADSLNLFLDTSELNEMETHGRCDSFERRVTDFATGVFESNSNFFDSGTRLRVKMTSLAFAIRQLESIRFSELPHDVKGAAFQVFLTASQRVGRGQFFTPEPVVEFCVGALAPSGGEIVVDPACGSGGFLASAFNFSLSFSSQPCIPVGYEISTTAARLARMRMFLIGAEASEIYQTDALVKARTLRDMTQSTVKQPAHDTLGFADVVLTNPPFGTQGKINDINVLSGFELGHRWDDNGVPTATKDVLRQQVPEILFIEQCVRLLRPGGRLGIVLPNGDFENSSLRYVREFLLREMTLDGIVKLPQETFVPSGTGIKTSLLFATKRSKRASRNTTKKVFFGEVTRLGYTGNKFGTTEFIRDSSGNVITDKDLRPVIDEDFSLVLSSFRHRGDSVLFPIFKNAYEIDEGRINRVRFDYEYHHPKYAALTKDLTHRGAVPLGLLVSVIKSRPGVLSKPDAEVRYVELSDIGLEYQEIMNSEPMLVHELPSRASFQVSSGQILLAVAGNSIGTRQHVSALVTPEFDGSICSNGFRVLEANESKIDPNYLLFALSTDEFRQQVFRFRTGAAIPNISDTDLLSILVPRQGSEIESRIANLVRDGFVKRRAFREEVNGFRTKKLST
jgi:type I restriction enzyme M protein